MGSKETIQILISVDFRSSCECFRSLKPFVKFIDIFSIELLEGKFYEYRPRT